MTQSNKPDIVRDFKKLKLFATDVAAPYVKEKWQDYDMVESLVAQHETRQAIREGIVDFLENPQSVPDMATGLVSGVSGLIVDNTYLGMLVAGNLINHAQGKPLDFPLDWSNLPLSTDWWGEHVYDVDTRSGGFMLGMMPLFALNPANIGRGVFKGKKGIAWLDAITDKSVKISRAFSDTDMDEFYGNFTQAEKMASKGIPIDNITAMTGWAKDRNGQWLFLMSHRGMKIRNDTDHITNLVNRYGPEEIQDVGGDPFVIFGGGDTAGGRWGETISGQMAIKHKVRQMNTYFEDMMKSGVGYIPVRFDELMDHPALFQLVPPLKSLYSIIPVRTGAPDPTGGPSRWMIDLQRTVDQSQAFQRLIDNPLSLPTGHTLGWVTQPTRNIGSNQEMVLFRTSTDARTHGATTAMSEFESNLAHELTHIIQHVARNNAETLSTAVFWGGDGGKAALKKGSGKLVDSKPWKDLIAGINKFRFVDFMYEMHHNFDNYKHLSDNALARSLFEPAEQAFGTWRRFAFDPKTGQRSVIEEIEPNKVSIFAERRTVSDEILGNFPEGLPELEIDIELGGRIFSVNSIDFEHRVLPAIRERHELGIRVPLTEETAVRAGGGTGPNIMGNDLWGYLRMEMDKENLNLTPKLNLLFGDLQGTEDLTRVLPSDIWDDFFRQLGYWYDINEVEARSVANNFRIPQEVLNTWGYDKYLEMGAKTRVGLSPYLLDMPRPTTAGDVPYRSTRKQVDTIPDTPGEGRVDAQGKELPEGYPVDVVDVGSEKLAEYATYILGKKFGYLNMENRDRYVKAVTARGKGDSDPMINLYGEMYPSAFEETKGTIEFRALEGQGAPTTEVSNLRDYFRTEDEVADIVREHKASRPPFQK